MASPLTSAQIEHFKTAGFVVLEGFIAPEQIATWHGQFWKHIDADPDDASTWPDSYVIDGFGTEPPLGQLPQVQAVIEQLGGGHFAGGGGSMLVQWPKEGQEWAPPAQGHIDGYGPGGWSGGFMLGATAYLEDVSHGGGAFTYWPQSHLPVHRYFLDNPKHIDGSFRDRDDWEERNWGMFSDEAPQGPVEWIAKAGDLILWHCFLCHTGSANISQRPRQAVFSRWHHQDRENMRWDIAEDLWKYWAI